MIHGAARHNMDIDERIAQFDSPVDRTGIFSMKWDVADGGVADVGGGHGFPHGSGDQRGIG